MSAPVTKAIDGVDVTCYPLPEYPKGDALFAELAYVAMPALSALGAAIGSKDDLQLIAKAQDTATQLALAAGLLGDDGAGKLIGAIEGSMQRLLIEDPKRLQRLTEELLSTCSAVVPKPGGGVQSIELNTAAKIQQCVAASGAGIQFLYRLRWFVLGVNFGRPFAGVFARMSKGDAPGPSTPTP